MNIVFLSDTYGKIVPFQRLDEWVRQLPIGGDDQITLFFFDYIIADLGDDAFLGMVMDTLDAADLIVACGDNSIEQMESDYRVHFRMPDLVCGDHENVYIRSQLNTLKVVIDTLRAKRLTY